MKKIILFILLLLFIYLTFQKEYFTVDDNDISSVLLDSSLTADQKLSKLNTLQTDLDKRITLFDVKEALTDFYAQHTPNRLQDDEIVDWTASLDPNVQVERMLTIKDPWAKGPSSRQRCDMIEYLSNERPDLFKTWSDNNPNQLRWYNTNCKSDCSSANRPAEWLRRKLVYTKPDVPGIEYSKTRYCDSCSKYKQSCNELSELKPGVYPSEVCTDLPVKISEALGGEPSSLEEIQSVLNKYVPKYELLLSKCKECHSQRSVYSNECVFPPGGDVGHKIIEASLLKGVSKCRERLAMLQDSAASETARIEAIMLEKEMRSTEERRNSPIRQESKKKKKKQDRKADKTIISVSPITSYEEAVNSLTIITDHQRFSEDNVAFKVLVSMPSDKHKDEPKRFFYVAHIRDRRIYDYFMGVNDPDFKDGYLCFSKDTLPMCLSDFKGDGIYEIVAMSVMAKIAERVMLFSFINPGGYALKENRQVASTNLYILVMLTQMFVLLKMAKISLNVKPPRNINPGEKEGWGDQFDDLVHYLSTRSLDQLRDRYDEYIREYWKCYYNIFPKFPPSMTENTFKTDAFNFPNAITALNNLKQDAAQALITSLVVTYSLTDFFCSAVFPKSLDKFVESLEFNEFANKPFANYGFLFQKKNGGVDYSFTTLRLSKENLENIVNNSNLFIEDYTFVLDNVFANASDNAQFVTCFSTLRVKATQHQLAVMSSELTKLYDRELTEYEMNHVSLCAVEIYSLKQEASVYEIVINNSPIVGAIPIDFSEKLDWPTLDKKEERLGRIYDFMSCMICVYQALMFAKFAKKKVNLVVPKYPYYKSVLFQLFNRTSIAASGKEGDTLFQVTFEPAAHYQILTVNLYQTLQFTTNISLRYAHKD